MAWCSAPYCDTFMGKTTYKKAQNDQKAMFNNQQSSSSLNSLESLQVGSTASVVGIVIAKESPKSIFTKKGSGTEKFLFSFVLRDSPTAFVNCTCWGSENHIKDLSRSFCIGDVVKIENAQVQGNATDGSDEKFRVSSPLGFHLSLSENHSSLMLYNGMDLGSYAPLQYIPIKPSTDYYTLEDVLANGQSLNGEHINLLTAVRKIGPARDITTKTGKHTKRCEIKLFDESCPSFPLVLWGEEVVDFAHTWTPLKTVLFVADVRMNYDDYRSGMVATADSKTVFTINPETVDAKCLFQFAQTQNFSLEDDGASNNTDKSDLSLDQITNVCVIEQLMARDGTAPEYGQLYGVLTKFDLDAENVDQFFRRKCSKCKQMVTAENGYQCTNPDCAHTALAVFNSTGEVKLEEPDTDFSIPVTVSDHTGSINTRLSESLLHAMTGIKVQDMMKLHSEQRTQYKWNFLMERCKFYFKVVKNFRQPERVSFKVLACTKADPEEMEHNISR